MTRTAETGLTLYHAPNSRSSTALWMLEELGEPYAVALKNFDDGSLKDAAYLAINAAGKVPSLTDGGVIVTETAAICCYLADTYPGAKLAPSIGDPRRGAYLKWLFFAPSCIEPAMADKMQNRQGLPSRALGWGSFDIMMDALLRGLGQGPFLLGEMFSAADVVVGSTVRFAMMFKIIPELPELVAYTARLTGRPAFKRAMAKDAGFAAKKSSA